MARPPRSPIDVLRTLLDSGMWFPHAIELHAGNGEKLQAEAEASVEWFEGQFQPGVAHMPVPRCDQCQWWDGPGIIGGKCRLFSADGVVREQHRIDRRAGLVNEHGENAESGELMTAANFGCVQWEAK